MTITITADKVQMKGRSMPVDKFCGLVAQNCVTGLRKEPIPDNVKWLVECGNHSLYVIELQPELRTVLWYEADKDGEWPKQRTIATPYVVVIALLYGNEVQSVHLYYRNQPLTSLDDKLYYTNLRNVSHGNMCIDGIAGNNRNHQDALNKLVNHIWSGEFNDEIIDGGDYGRFREFNDLDINEWERLSKKNPKFVLDMAWRSTGKSPKEIINIHAGFILRNSQTHSTQLGNLILKAK